MLKRLGTIRVSIDIGSGKLEVEGDNVFTFKSKQDHAQLHDFEGKWQGPLKPTRR